MRRRWTSWSATTLSVVLALSAAGAAPALAQDDGFDFEPLRMPFPAGEGTVINGYDDGSRHTKGDRYGLDLCGADGCAIGDRVLAPTGLTLEYSGDYNGIADDPDDFHIFEIDRTDTGRLCLALAHFDLTADDDGTRTFEPGQELGMLLDFRSGTTSVPHHHVSLWTVAGTDGCAVRDDDPADPRRFPLAFDGPYALDGQSFPATATNTEQEGRAVVSTNGADPVPDTPDTARIAHWIAPVEGAKVGPKVQLAAGPTPVLLDGTLTDDPTTARVDFHATIDGEQVPACSAKKADDTGAWSCRTNLLDHRPKEGQHQLTIDDHRTDAGQAPAPGSVRTVTYALP